MPERSTQAISGICEDATKTHTCGAHPVDFRKGDLGLGPVITNIFRNSGAIKPGDIASPALRQEEP
ncbi:hypothetical protein SIAM614_02121 [Stappia aggregata IAM 12614]|uniref:Uncharacterized protein n=1 Tax=Roseibium aggregatum (strain ATCC 25650 / DSM 13394 / JCM 20685 / NBRC 16684 / NCIMB 2208 / IAM 12614 / B1) TaxID=384765 RepID=A0P1L6_ROSAI|nr:hypothetical protein SIAM614_02121 [Stappia aggregata IAM 12614] [Roseibium aggregatum IAM 12614]